MVQSVLLSWSSGKDSALSFMRLQESPNVRVVGLFTTYDQQTRVLPIQGVSLELVEAQAKTMNLPLVKIPIPSPCPNFLYEKHVLTALKSSPVSFNTLAFGDVYLSGIREYRESFLRPAGHHILFPLFGANSVSLAEEIQTRGIKAVVVSVDTTQLAEKYCGQQFNDEFIKSLPGGIDKCGENGEFHTFVYNAPFFTQEIKVHTYPKRSDGRWVYQDLLVQDV